MEKIMSKTVVIYHKADFDGIFCREIARKFLPEAQLIGWDYGDSQAVIPPGTEIIYMLDISLDEWMKDPRVIWIDHHKSAMEKFGALPGYQIDGVAACRLAWNYFAGGRAGNGECYSPATKQQYFDRAVEPKEPTAVRLAGEYDIWDKRDPNAELFQHGLKSRELTYEWWHDLLGTESEQYCHTLLEAGKVLQYARTEENASIIKAAGFTLEFEGLKFLACNHARYNSFLFTAGLTPEHDACFGFCWRGGQWVVSLYHAPGKEHHDLSLIATKYGGGGHRGACGFSTSKLPFLP